jgi:hypothetical protein
MPFHVSEAMVSHSNDLMEFCLAAVLTFCACTPPLDQVLQLWDFLFAFGVHLNVLCVIAQMLLMRDELIVSPRPVFYRYLLSNG